VVRYAALLAKVPTHFAKMQNVIIENDQVVLIGRESSQRVNVAATGIGAHFS
jgi:hypothetical protein